MWITTTDADLLIIGADYVTVANLDGRVQLWVRAGLVAETQSVCCGVKRALSVEEVQRHACRKTTNMLDPAAAMAVEQNGDDTDNTSS